jgi:hypothetical protein
MRSCSSFSSTSVAAAIARYCASEADCPSLAKVAASTVAPPEAAMSSPVSCSASAVFLGGLGAGLPAPWPRRVDFAGLRQLVDRRALAATCTACDMWIRLARVVGVASLLVSASMPPVCSDLDRLSQPRQVVDHGRHHVVGLGHRVQRQARDVGHHLDHRDVLLDQRGVGLEAVLGVDRCVHRPSGSAGPSRSSWPWRGRRPWCSPVSSVACPAPRIACSRRPGARAVRCRRRCCPTAPWRPGRGGPAGSSAG